MAKEKVYKLAQEFNMSSEALVQLLRQMGHAVKVMPPDSVGFGGAQLIVRLSDDLADGYAAGSDHRRDGQAVGF